MAELKQLLIRFVHERDFEWAHLPEKDLMSQVTIKKGDAKKAAVRAIGSNAGQ